MDVDEMKILSVVGARPQFVKLAPLHNSFVADSHDHLILHTGQHYDHNMSEVFFRDLRIPSPDVNLEVGSLSHGAQTGRMLEKIEEVLISKQPDWVVVYGDTNSTLAGALAAVKLHIRVAHVEAGLRSGNRMMPEEHNRVLTDHASDVLLAPSQLALRNLQAEGLGLRSVEVGDVMVDACFQTRDSVLEDRPPMPHEWDDQFDFFLATIHRQENTDDPSRLKEIIGFLSRSPLQVRLLAHPRLVKCAKNFGIDLAQGSIRVFAPLTYPQLVRSILDSQGVITDSGGLQKEAFLLKSPCITLRPETEWPETVELGWNRLDPRCESSLEHFLSESRRTIPSNPYGDGQAAGRVVAAIERFSS